MIILPCILAKAYRWALATSKPMRNSSTTLHCTHNKQSNLIKQHYSLHRRSRLPTDQMCPSHETRSIVIKNNAAAYSGHFFTAISEVINLGCVRLGVVVKNFIIVVQPLLFGDPRGKSGTRIGKFLSID